MTLEGEDCLRVSFKYMRMITIKFFSCQDIFLTIDSDKSGAINITELLDFLTAIGGDIDKTEV